VVTATPSNNPGHIASFLKAVAAAKGSGDDLPLGHVYMAGNDPSNSPSAYVNSVAGITWTSPSGGVATVSGGLWEVSKNLGRTENWQLSRNGVLLTSGVLRPSDPYNSTNPFDFALGSGGAGALVIPLSSHDVLDLEVVRSPGEPAALVGINWTINLSNVSSVPEPSTFGPAAIGITALALAGWRRTRSWRN
jgi:hypothetical protein